MPSHAQCPVVIFIVVFHLMHFTKNSYPNLARYDL